MRFFRDPATVAWGNAVRPAATAAIDDPAHKHWWRSGDTWFVGVNALPNDPDGRVGDSPPLAGAAVDFALGLGLTDSKWDRAQVSVMYPGYPQQDATETDAAFRFRRDRNAAHVDGLRPEGPERRRYLREPHAFVLGLPLDDTRACPMVVWRGSHRIMHAAFAKAFDGVPVSDWGQIDLTEIYADARRAVFETCDMVELHTKPGEAYVIHRMALHGVLPWYPPLKDPRRAIVYFRPECTGGALEWLTAP